MRNLKSEGGCEGGEEGERIGDGVDASAFDIILFTFMML